MPRPATGTIVERRNRGGKTTRLLRFTVNGSKRAVALGVVGRQEAEDRLALELARVRAGDWEPPKQDTPASPKADVLTFHEYADEWWTLHEHVWEPKTVTDYRGRATDAPCSPCSASHAPGAIGPNGVSWRGANRHDAE
jgi:hypothetical protein